MNVRPVVSEGTFLPVNAIICKSGYKLIELKKGWEETEWRLWTGLKKYKDKGKIYYSSGKESRKDTEG